MYIKFINENKNVRNIKVKKYNDEILRIKNVERAV